LSGPSSGSGSRSGELLQRHRTEDTGVRREGRAGRSARLVSQVSTNRKARKVRRDFRQKE